MSIDFSEARKLKRFPLLDASRGLACIGVVAMHCQLEPFMPWYWGVMDFFFVMSGFLITRSLISNSDKGRGTSSFLLYRALRLLPAYLSVMLIYAVTAIVRNGMSPYDILPYVFLYQNTDLIFGTEEIFPRIHEILPFWSLILEEHFYVLWGILFCAYAYVKLKITPATFAIVALLFGLAIIMRKAGAHYWTLPGRFDGFLAGSFAGLIIFMPQKVHISEQWKSRLVKLAWFIVPAATVRLVWSVYISYYRYSEIPDGIWLDVTAFTIVSVVLVLGLVKMDVRGIQFGRMQGQLAFLGLLSYEIYLVHFPIVTLLTKAFNFEFRGGAFLLFPITMIVSTVVAYMMHKILTAPALRKRESIHSFFENLFGSASRAAGRVAMARQQAVPAPPKSEDLESGQVGSNHR